MASGEAEAKVRASCCTLAIEDAEMIVLGFRGRGDGYEGYRGRGDGREDYRGRGDGHEGYRGRGRGRGNIICRSGNKRLTAAVFTFLGEGRSGPPPQPQQE